jgi:hypothetical protein
MPGGFRRRNNLLIELNNSGRWGTEQEMRKALTLAATKLLHREMSQVLSGDADAALDVVEFYGKFESLVSTGDVK